MSETPPDDLNDPADTLEAGSIAHRRSLPTLDGLAGGLTLLAPDGLAAALGAGPSRFGVVDRVHYEVAGEVGRGGIGRVLRACDTRLNRPVALKELLGGAGDLAEERF